MLLLVSSSEHGSVKELCNLFQFYNVSCTFAVKCTLCLIHPVPDSHPLELLSGSVAKLPICVRWQTNGDINEVIALVRKSIFTQNSQCNQVGLNGDLVPM